MASSLVRARTMTIKVLPRPLRRVPPARPGRRPHIPLPPFPILVAEPPLKLPHPFITDATVIHTTTRVSLQQLPLSILTQHLQPPPMHSPPTRSRGLTRALRPQSGPRKTLSPQATFITTVSLRLVRLFRPLRFILMRPHRPSQRLPTLANRPLPGSVKFQPGPLQQLATTVAFIALILPHLPLGSHVRPPSMADYDDMWSSPYSYLRPPSPDAPRPRVSRLTVPVSPQKHSRTQSSSSDSDYPGPSSRTRRSLEVHDAIAGAEDKKKARELRDQAKRSAREMQDARDRAKIAHRRGDREAESEYKQEARAQESAKKNLDKRAATIFFRVNNKVRYNHEGLDCYIYILIRPLPIVLL